MKRTILSVSAVMFAIMVLTAPVAAATSQGLDWGVEDNDRFNYQLQADTLTDTIDERLYWDVTADPAAIPNVLTDWTAIPVVTTSAFWENGTSMGLAVLLFVFIGLVGARTCVPIGNYTLMSELLLDDYTENVTIIDNYYFWGAKYSGLMSGDTFTVTATYLKSDGFMATYAATQANETDTLFTINVVRDGLPSDIQVLIMSNLLLIGIGVVVLIIIGAVACKKR